MPQVAAATWIQAGVAAVGMYSANKRAKKMRRQSATQANQALAERKEQQKQCVNKLRIKRIKL